MGESRAGPMQNHKVSDRQRYFMFLFQLGILSVRGTTACRGLLSILAEPTNRVARFFT